MSGSGKGLRISKGLKLVVCLLRVSELGIYKRKQESKKTRTRPRKRSRKQELDQESDHEKRKTILFFLITFLVEILFSCFLTSLFSFINSHLRSDSLTIETSCYYLYTFFSVVVPTSVREVSLD